MRMMSMLRYGAAGLALAVLGVFAIGQLPAPAHSQASFVQNGETGFVVANITYALGEDASQTGACPRGMTAGMGSLDEVFAGARAAPGADPAAAQREFFERMSRDNPCSHPVEAGPDAGFRVVEGPNAPAYGIDLDGQNSTASGRPAPGTCAHADFRGFNGERGIDNQFFRVVGCSTSFQSTGLSNNFAIEMLTGAWGILISLKGVDDIRNDSEVEVGFYANADPIQLSPSREPLANATYAMDQDPRFRAVTRGRIVNGVLTTEPVNVRFHYIVNSIRLERPLEDARVRMTLSADGVLEGYLAGYTPVEAMYDVQYGFRNGQDSAGQPAPLQLRVISSIGQAAVLGHTCNGAYFALQAAADGHRDPATGRCTALSTQYRIRAIPAFVVDAATTSANEGLDPTRDQRY